MKNLKRIIKGLLVSIMLAMVLSFSLDLALPDSAPFVTPSTHADEETEENAEEAGTTLTADEAAILDADLASESAKTATGLDLVLLQAHESNAETPQTAKSKDDFTFQIARLANLTHRFFAPMINFCAFHIGNFLGNDYIFNGPMGDMLQKIWVISRNLVNIAFVFILLWMALKEIFYVNQESDLKKNLIKFVLLLVAVNFSWLGTKVVLDAANVVTHAVFAIPSGISDPPPYGACVINPDAKGYTGACYPTSIFSPANSGAKAPLYFEDKEGEDNTCAEIKKRYMGSADSAYTSESEINPKASPANKELQGRTSFCMEGLNLIKYNQNTAVIYLTYGSARIQHLVEATRSANLDDLAVGVLLSLVIQLAYSVALLALFIALIIRMAMLWFFVAFSPFLVLMIWFSGAEDYDFGEFKFGIKEFANWAFVPAKVGAIFAVSFIMISSGQAAGEIGGKIFDVSAVKSGVTLEILDVRSLFGSIGSLQTFIWLLMSLVILWIGTFAVLSKMSVVNKITDRIRDAGSRLGTLVATSPYWAPIMPLGKGGQKASVQSLWQGVNPISKLESYKGDPKGNAARDLQNNARGKDFSSQAQRMLEPGATEGVRRNLANQIASKLGFSNVQELFKVHKDDRNTVVDALKTARIPDDQAGAVFDAMKRFEHEEGIKTPLIPQRASEVSSPPPAAAGGGAAGGGAAGGGAAGGGGGTAGAGGR